MELRQLKVWLRDPLGPMFSGIHQEVMWWLEPLSRAPNTLASCLQFHHIDLRATLPDFTARKATCFH